MKLSVNWKGLLVGVAWAAVYAAYAASRSMNHHDGTVGLWVFGICLAVFLWPVLRDLAKVLRWKPRPNHRRRESSLEHRPAEKVRSSMLTGRRSTGEDGAM